MSRKDIVVNIKTKENKAMSGKLVSFWDGVLTTIRDACRVKTFSELDYFSDFEEFALQKLQNEEKVYKKCISE